MSKANLMTGACGAFLLLAAMVIAMPAQTTTISPTVTFTTLHTFNGADGANPSAGLVQSTDGHLYGTTAIGGANNDGTVFAISPAGMLTTLHSFDGMDGVFPSAGLVQGTDGKFYGTTSFGGANSCPAGNCGTVFSLSVGLGQFVEVNPGSTK